MPPSEEQRCREAREFRRIDEAYKAGDMDELCLALGDPPDFPNGPGPLGIGYPLPYAIYHSPLAFIRALLEAGADPNLDPHDGFPAMIAAVSCLWVGPGHPGRRDVPEILRLLLAFGADINQRGLNDYTALHWVAGTGNAAMVQFLLELGADPSVRTRIDDWATPLEEAERAGRREAAGVLRAWLVDHLGPAGTMQE